MLKRSAVLAISLGLFTPLTYPVMVSAQEAVVAAADKEALFAAAVTECCAQLLPHQLFVPDPGLPVAEALFQIARPL